MKRGKGTDRVLDILEFLAEANAPCTAPEISKGISSPKSTTYLLLDQLLDRGYIYKLDSGKFVLGHFVAMLGRSAMQNLDLPRIIRDLMNDLAVTTNQLSEFVCLDGWKQMVLIAASPKRASYLLSEEGSRHPLPRTASSRFLLRDLPAENVLPKIPSDDFVLRDGTIMEYDAFLSSINSARDKDIFSLDGQIDPHLSCIASPVYNYINKVVATASVVAPTSEVNENLVFYSKEVKNTAQLITRHISLVEVDQHSVLGLFLSQGRTLI